MIAEQRQEPVTWEVGGGVVEVMFVRLWMGGWMRLARVSIWCG